MPRRILLGLAVLAIGVVVAVMLLRGPEPVSRSAGFGDWRVDCRGDAEGCVLSQQVIDGERGQRLIALNLIVRQGAPEVARLVVPLGSLISAGTLIALGDFRQENLLPETCDRTGCTFSFMPDEAFLAAARGTRQGTAIFMTPEGNPASIPFSLDGFSDALAMARSETGLLARALAVLGSPLRQDGGRP